MEKLKIDRSKLITLANYAKEKGVTRQTIYNMARDKKIKVITIDGVMFVER